MLFLAFSYFFVCLLSRKKKQKQNKKNNKKNKTSKKKNKKAAETLCTAIQTKLEKEKDLQYMTLVEKIEAVNGYINVYLQSLFLGEFLSIVFISLRFVFFWTFFRVSI